MPEPVTTARPTVDPMVSWTEGSLLKLPARFNLRRNGATASLVLKDGGEWCDPDLITEPKAPTDPKFTAVGLRVAGFTATSTTVSWTLEYNGPTNWALLKEAHDLIANGLCE